MSKKDNQSGGRYNRAKIWQIALFVMNNTATNVFMVLMGYYAFYTQNVLGLAAIVVGMIATLMRIWDGVTDPIIGYFLDKTNGKFGKFRPFMVIGNLIMIASALMVFRTPLEQTITYKYIWTTIFYVIYIIGYTFQTACTKGAQAALTNDPQQRPLFTWFDAIYNILLFSGSTFLITTIMAPQYVKNMIDPQLWLDVSLILAGISAVLTVFAVIGIWQKDRTEFFGTGEKVETKFTDYLNIIKHNRPLQMLIVAASTDKLANVAVRGAQVYFFSNILLNVALNGKYSLYAILPSFLITTIGVMWSRKAGIKKAFVASTWASTILIMVLAALTIPMTSGVSAGIVPTSVIVLLSIFAIQQGMGGIAGNIVIPMIADCSDYETYRSGRFIPGMMGTLFSFVDKLISSFSTFIIGAAIAWAGYGAVKIEPNSAVNSKFLYAIMFIMWGLPWLGHVASIIAMKFYTLDDKKMVEIQNSLHERRQKTSIGKVAVTEGINDEA
ncbi:MAG: MFS transporter [Eubacteriales bacterium]|nr:MFS transporter [Eubacteriales bacterium]